MATPVDEKQIDSGVFVFHIKPLHESRETTLYEPYESAQRKGNTGDWL
jgi:hypothetical protein